MVRVFLGLLFVVTCPVWIVYLIGDLIVDEWRRG